MTTYIIITEKEISETPNDFELGKLVRMKYIKSKEGQGCPICGAEKKCTPEEENCKKDL
jgi:hypothetical protein